MASQFTRCEIFGVADRSEIVYVLKQYPRKISRSSSILIGSRAARQFLPNFRGISEDNNADWDIIISSKMMLKWLHKKRKNINTIRMIIPQSNNGDQLDLYIYCTLHDGSKYDFDVPRSSTSYTAYMLSHPDRWAMSRSDGRIFRNTTKPRFIASVKLLLILKKYMLYYSHQWEKTAKDYYELLAVTTPLTADDMKLCNMVIKYNEQVHGRRLFNSDEFVINSTNAQQVIIIHRDDFFQYRKEKQISLIHRVAMSLSFSRDLLIGLKHICTQGPLWFADYVIENWTAIYEDKFKENFQVLNPPIQFEVDNYRLFPDIPEIATKRILHFITDTADFYSMQFVCKKWYTILHEEIFWRDLYTARYGACSSENNRIYNWKMLYLVRMEGKFAIHNNILDQLVDATIKLRQYTANHILKLWEDLTDRVQSVEPILLSKIKYILSNSFYYQIEKTSEEYSVRLIIIGLEHEWSRSKVHLELRVGEYGSSRFTDHMEHLSIRYESGTNEQRSLAFFGPALFGFNFYKWGYTAPGRTYLGRDASTISDQYPSGLLICLFIRMVHPDHRAHFIEYLITRETHCSPPMIW